MKPNPRFAVRLVGRRLEFCPSIVAVVALTRLGIPLGAAVTDNLSAKIVIVGDFAVDSAHRLPSEPISGLDSLPARCPAGFRPKRVGRSKTTRHRAQGKVRANAESQSL